MDTKGVDAGLSVSELMSEIQELRDLVQESQETSKSKPKTSPSYLVVPSQKLSSFSGQTTIKLEDWIYDITTAVKSRPLSTEAEVDFALQHLSGPAREEVKYHEMRRLSDVFSVLRRTFGDQGSNVQLQRLFFERKQKPEENLRDFSHSLLDLFSRAARKSPQLMEKREHLLKDQFAEGVADISLRKYLKSKIRELPNLDFFELRTEAIEWAEESELLEASNYLAPRQVQLEATVAKSDTKTLLDVMHKQQQQLEAQQKQISHLSQLIEEKLVDLPKTPQPLNKPPTGNKPKCDYCNRIGHTKANCYKKQLQEANDTIEELRKSINASKSQQGN